MAAPATAPRRTRTHGVPSSTASARAQPGRAQPARGSPAPRIRSRAVTTATRDAPSRATRGILALQLHERAERRPLQRATPDVPVRPELRVVPRRRRALGLAVAGFTLLFGLMLGATALQTRLAQNQLQLDRVDRELAAAKETYDVLRRQRAELRSPGRLAIEAERLGMVPGESSEFVTVPPDVVAQMQAAASDVPADVGGGEQTPLDEFSAVKAVAGAAP